MDRRPFKHTDWYLLAVACTAGDFAHALEILAKIKQQRAERERGAR